MSSPTGRALSGPFRALLRRELPAWDPCVLPPDAWLRIERMADPCQIDARLLLQHPDYALRPGEPRNREANHRNNLEAVTVCAFLGNVQEERAS